MCIFTVHEEFKCIAQTTCYGLCLVRAAQKQTKMYTTVNHYVPSIPFTVYGAVRSLFLPCPPLQQAQHPQSGIEHTVMFKDHLIEGVQRQSASRICVLQCSHGHVQPVGLVTQGRLLGCNHFNSLLHHKNKKHMSTLKRAKTIILRDPLNQIRNINCHHLPQPLPLVSGLTRRRPFWSTAGKFHGRSWRSPRPPLTDPSSQPPRILSFRTLLPQDQAPPESS